MKQAYYLQIFDIQVGCDFNAVSYLALILQLQVGYFRVKYVHFSEDNQKIPLLPTVQELTNENFNRYEIALASAKCARMITDEYVTLKEAAEKAVGSSKDADRSVINKLNKEYREEKALKTALNMIRTGEYKLVRLEETEQAAKLEEEAALAE